MDSSVEFASLVAKHRRLMEKYEQNRCTPPNDTSSRQTNPPSNSTSEPAMRRVDGTPWIDMAHASTPRKLPYLTSEALEPRCCPRCHYSMEPKSVDVLSTPFPKTIPEPNKAMAPSFATDGVVGINHMIQLQLASMEYARLLSALRTGSCLPPPPPFYHDQHVRPYVIDPLSSNRFRCCVCGHRRRCVGRLVQVVVEMIRHLNPRINERIARMRPMLCPHTGRSRSSEHVLCGQKNSMNDSWRLSRNLASTKLFRKPYSK